MADVILFDRDQVDHLDSLANRPRRLSGTQLLWVDVDRGEDVQDLAETFDLADPTP